MKIDLVSDVSFPWCAIGLNAPEQALFEACFTDGLDRGDHGVVRQAAVAAGLDADAARNVLSGDDYAAEVRERALRQIAQEAATA